jgi:hypothetical protein
MTCADMCRLRCLAVGSALPVARNRRKAATTLRPAFAPFGPSAFTLPRPHLSHPFHSHQIPIALAGAWGLFFGYKYGYRARFLVPAFFMLLVGLGSISFHVSWRGSDGPGGWEAGR